MTKDEIVDDIIDSMDMSLNKLWEMVKDREAWHAAVHRVTKIEGKKRRRRQRMRWLDGITDTRDMSLSKRLSSEE